MSNMTMALGKLIKRWTDEELEFYLSRPETDLDTQQAVVQEMTRRGLFEVPMDWDQQ